MKENFLKEEFLFLSRVFSSARIFYYTEIIQFTSNKNILSRFIKRVLIKNNLYGSSYKKLEKAVFYVDNVFWRVRRRMVLENASKLYHIFE